DCTPRTDGGPVSREYPAQLFRGRALRAPDRGRPQGSLKEDVMTPSKWLCGIAFVGLVMAAPARVAAQPAVDPADHAAHHPPAASTSSATAAAPADAKITGAKLDELLAKVKATTGAAKTDAMVELLTALVQDKKDCEAKMASMMKK